MFIINIFVCMSIHIFDCIFEFILLVFYPQNIFFWLAYNELDLTTFLGPESLEGTLGTGTPLAEAREVPERNVSQTERGLVPKRSVKSLLCVVAMVCNRIA
ncbi:hypothetical protein CH361_18920 [Leptospira brenneri]|nr:hypothetical protein CH361_18920 [Leptospira brenneri]